MIDKLCFNLDYVIGPSRYYKAYINVMPDKAVPYLSMNDPVKAIDRAIDDGIDLNYLALVSYGNCLEEFLDILLGEYVDINYNYAENFRGLLSYGYHNVNGYYIVKVDNMIHLECFSHILDDLHLSIFDLAYIKNASRNFIEVVRKHIHKFKDIEKINIHHARYSEDMLEMFIDSGVDPTYSFMNNKELIRSVSHKRYLEILIKCDKLDVNIYDYKYRTLLYNYIDINADSINNIDMSLVAKLIRNGYDMSPLKKVNSSIVKKIISNKGNICVGKIDEIILMMLENDYLDYSNLVSISHTEKFTRYLSQEIANMGSRDIDRILAKFVSTRSNSYRKRRFAYGIAMLTRLSDRYIFLSPSVNMKKILD